MAFLCKKLVFTCASINKNFNWNPAGFFIKHCIEKIFEMCADFFHKNHKFQFLISSLLAIRHEQLHFYYTSIQYSWQADIWEIFTSLEHLYYTSIQYSWQDDLWEIFTSLEQLYYASIQYSWQDDLWEIFTSLEQL